MDLVLNKQLEVKLKEELSYALDYLPDIVEDKPDDLPKITEEDFKKYLLPYMLNLVERDNDNDKAFFNNWMNLVGDIVLPFYVVDDSGNILFKVPRYLGRFDNNETPIEDVSYITILKEFEAEYERFPEKAEIDLAETMKALSSIVKVDPESLRELFNFYVFLRERYRDYYNYYKSQMLIEQITVFENRINELKEKMYDLDPESREYSILSKELNSMENELEKIKNELKKYGNDLPYKEENDSEIDYMDIDYED